MHSNRELARRLSAIAALAVSSVMLQVACDDDAGPIPSAVMGGGTGEGTSSGGTSNSGGSASNPGGSGNDMLGTGETGPDIGGVDGDGGSSMVEGGGAGAGSEDPACALDVDFDGTNDCLDGCPSDALKTAEGQCGCGIPDSDIDGDGTIDCEDGCAADPNKTEAGECGCGRADADTDGDGPLDCDDACPFDATRTVAGACGCGVADDLALCLRHRYSFDGTGATATDSVGDADGVIMNKTLAGDGTLVLAGLDTDEFVDLPDGIISALGASATFEVWLTWTGAGGPWQRIFDFGSSDQPATFQGGGATYLFVTPSNTLNTHLRAAFTNAAPPAERAIDAPTALPFPVLAHVAVVVDGPANSMAMYLNGALVGTQTLEGTTLSDLDDVNNWIGRSQFIADDELQATLTEFRIYSAARSAAQILAEFTLGPEDLPEE